MKATQELHNLGQSLWLDNITRDLLDNGTLKRYIDEFSVTGLTSNPTIFEHAISKSKSYDDEIGRLATKGLSGEELFFELALQDLTRAAALFASIHERTAGNDGFVSSKCPLSSLMTQLDRRLRRLHCTRRRIARTSSSRYRGQRKEIWRLRKLPRPVPPSTSHFFFLVSTMSHLQTHTCVGWNGVSQTVLALMSDP